MYVQMSLNIVNQFIFERFIYCDFLEKEELAKINCHENVHIDIICNKGVALEVMLLKTVLILVRRN